MPLLLLLFLLIPATDLSAGNSPLSFADSLAAEGDHYRAITEYKRFLHAHPSDRLAPEAQLAIARSLLAGKRWQQLDPALEKVWQLYPQTPEAAVARELYAEAAFSRGDYAEARARYQQLKRSQPDVAVKADYRIGLSYLEEGKIDAAEQSFAAIEGEEGAQLQQFINTYRQLPRKSPALAGSLSAVLPGAGQLYTERPRQAAVAFALNAAFIYGAVEAWNNENYAVAGLLSLFEIGWYGGNIVNAMNNAHKYNHRLEEAARDGLQQTFGLNLGWGQSAPQLQAWIRF